MSPGTAESTDELIDEIGTEAARRVMGTAHLDLREHVFVAGLAAEGVDVNHGAGDMEERDHLGNIVGNDERVGLAGRLEDVRAFGRLPVVFEVVPAAAQ